MGSKTIKQITETQTSVKETDWFELQEDSSETSKKVQASFFGVPIGTIIMYAKATAPTNYLICDGAAVSRTTYATLFAVIGTVYGVGDNSTTFNLPDYRAVTPKGVGDQTINTRVKTGPASVGEKIEDTMQGFKIFRTQDSGAVAGGTDIRQSGAYKLPDIYSVPENDGTNGTPRTCTQTQDCTIGTNFCIKYQ